LATNHIGHNGIGHSKTIPATTENYISHTENPYRAQTISATNHMMSLSRLIISLLHAYIVIHFTLIFEKQLSIHIFKQLSFKKVYYMPTLSTVFQRLK